MLPSEVFIGEGSISLLLGTGIMLAKIEFKDIKRYKNLELPKCYADNKNSASIKFIKFAPIKLMKKWRVG